MPSKDKKQDWLISNEQRLMRRLQWLRQQPNGDIYRKTSSFHEIVVHKAGSQLQLLFRDPTATDVMSRLDLTNPLRLVSAYTQAMMLGLVWMPQPQKIYVLGLGGGRLPLLLHHYFREVEIECSELDPTVVEIAERFFGVAPDERLKVITREGREYLESLKAQTGYDLIMLDAFRGTGYGPYRLATIEFHRLCQRRLSPQGVVVANLLDIDPLYKAKIFTFCQAFEQAYLCLYQDATVLIGTNNRPGLQPFEIINRAEALQELYHFHFPLEQVAHKVLGGAEVAEYLTNLSAESLALLEDDRPPQHYLQQLDTASPIFSKARRDDPCPCASGKKFKHCHGRMS